MIKYLKDLATGVVLELLVAFIVFILAKLQIISDHSFQLFLNGFIPSIPVLTILLWLGYRIYRNEERIRRHNALVAKVHMGHWAHISALINNYIELNKLQGAQEFQQLKAILEQTYYDKYKDRIRDDLQKVYPNKTRPQVEKIVNELTSLE